MAQAEAIPHIDGTGDAKCQKAKDPNLHEIHSQRSVCIHLFFSHCFNVTKEIINEV